MAEWHPILAADEREPGRWDMIDPAGRTYGTIEIRRTPDGIRYRCEHRGELIGWATSLRTACERVHYAYLRSHSPAGGAEAFGQYGAGARENAPAQPPRARGLSGGYH